jgi:rhamnosyl/mannosyltransferase
MMRDNCDQIIRFSDNVRVIPLGIETDEMPSFDATLNGRSILFVGRLVDFKGVHVLLAAMKNVDASLTVVGDGPQADNLQRYARTEGVSDSVTFEGYVSDEWLDHLYKESDVFVLPSKGANESFGIVQLEAMKYGLPVINTNLPTGVPYVSVDGKTGLTVPPGDSAALSEAIDWLFAHPKEYERYSRQARNRVLDKFKKSAMLKAMSSLYHETLQVS